MPRRLRHPGPGPDVQRGARRLAREGRGQAGDRHGLPHGGHRPEGGRHARGAGDAARPGRHLVQAVHGLQGRADGRRRDALPHDGSRGEDRRARDGARGERRRDRRTREAGARGRQHGAEVPRAHATARGRGRGNESRDPARLPRRRAALRRPRHVQAGGRADRSRAREGLERVGRDVHAVLLQLARRHREAELRGREVRLLSPGPRQVEPRRAVERRAHGRALGDLDRSLRVPLRRPKDARQGRLLEDPQRRARAREPAADDPRVRRPRRADLAQPHGRAAGDEPGEAVRALSAQGHGRRRLRRGSRDLRPGPDRDDLRCDAPLEGGLQPL